MGPGARVGAVVITLHPPGWHRGSVEPGWPAGGHVARGRLEAGAHARLGAGAGNGHGHGAGLSVEAAPPTNLIIWRNRNSAMYNCTSIATHRTSSTALYSE